MLAQIVAGKKHPEIPIMVAVPSIAAAMGEAPEKVSAGEAITHELINIAHTRHGAQFSLGKANLTHHSDLASGPGKIISIFGIGFVPFFKHLYLRHGWSEPKICR
jgi:hypothetical protein